MNSADLFTILVTEGFRSSAYSLESEDKDEALCLRVEGHGWCVYYSERGLQTDKTYFLDESSACEFFLNEMREDPTTKISWKSGFCM